MIVAKGIVVIIISLFIYQVRISSMLEDLIKPIFVQIYIFYHQELLMVQDIRTLSDAITLNGWSSDSQARNAQRVGRVDKATQLTTAPWYSIVEQE